MPYKNTRFLSDLWSSEGSEPQHLRIVVHTTSDQLKAWSDIHDHSSSWSRTSASSLDFSNLTLVLVNLLQGLPESEITVALFK